MGRDHRFCRQLVSKVLSTVFSVCGQEAGDTNTRPVTRNTVLASKTYRHKNRKSRRPSWSLLTDGSLVVVLAFLLLVASAWVTAKSQSVSSSYCRTNSYRMLKFSGDAMTRLMTPGCRPPAMDSRLEGRSTACDRVVRSTAEMVPTSPGLEAS